ncbi:MAG: FAD-dependent oxidoreductase, partial [Rhizobiales bacterium]|nr:FAD-dependent oxidoreductase [Hyphomicrobiales bacterium]
MANQSFDVVIVGAGPGGYVTAIRAAQLGLSTAVIEREHLGGICLNWGCIPTKALLRSSEVFHLMQNAKDYGLKADNVSFDLAALVKRSRRVARQLSHGVGHLLKKNKVTVIDGEAKLAGKGKLTVAKDGKAVGDIEAKHIIIATGARARELPHLKADGEAIWTYKQAMVPEALPKSILVIGSGAIGIEFASFYRTLGAEVTVVEMLDRILPVEDEEISALAAKAFTKQGMTLITGATVENTTSSKTGVKATIKTMDGKTQEITAERMILA